MKKIQFFIFYFLCVSLFSCQDDEIIPDIPKPGEQIDEFIGEHKLIRMEQGMENFHHPEFICRISTPNGKVIKRRGIHQRMNDISSLEFREGLKEGIYQLLELKYPKINPATNDTVWAEYGLGCKIDVTSQDIKVMDTYNKDMRMFGLGTVENPYKITSGDHLITLMKVTEHYDTNRKFLKADTYFRQDDDLDMERACFDCSEYGWLGIGNPSNPFRGIFDGNGYKITNLQSSSIKRNTENNDSIPKEEKTRIVDCIGLFRIVASSSFINVKLENVTIEGDFAVGGLIGALVCDGDKVEQAAVIKCSISNNSKIIGLNNSVSVGGLVGTVDEQSVLVLDSCQCYDTKIIGDYNVGGLLGGSGRLSHVHVTECENDNKTSVTSRYSCVGGLVGVSDTLVMMACTNKASVSGATEYIGAPKTSGIGAGGLVGGSGSAEIISCINDADVTGNIGVGGLLGSTRLGAEKNGDGSFFLREINMTDCYNNGEIVGNTSVGGLCGEAQFSGYSLINEGKVQALATEKAIAGGIVGNTSACTTHNALNCGEIIVENGLSVGGIAGQSVWGSFFTCQNYCDQQWNTDYGGGILGLGGQCTSINYCANYGNLTGKKSPCVISGIAGEIGDARNWDAKHTANCVLAAVGMAVPLISFGVGSAAKKWGGIFKVFGGFYKVVMNYIRTPYKIISGTMGTINTSILIANKPELQTRKNNVEFKAEDISGVVKEKLVAVREGFNLQNIFLYSGVNRDVLNSYKENTNRLLNYNELNDDNNATINYNINDKREARYQEIEEWEKREDIIHVAIGGICVLASATLAIASSVAGGVPAAAAAITTLSTVTGFVGGMNTIVAKTTDFNNNAVLVSQCVNFGNLEHTNNSAEVVLGGIVGHLNEYGMVYDCLNLGKSSTFNSDAKISSGAIVGSVEHRTETYNLLNMGSGWNNVVYSYYDNDVCRSNCYYLKEKHDNATNHITITLDELGKIDTYDHKKSPSDPDMDIKSDDKGLWQLIENKGNFPIPCWSEMQKEMPKQDK